MVHILAFSIPGLRLLTKDLSLSCLAPEKTMAITSSILFICCLPFHLTELLFLFSGLLFGVGALLRSLSLGFR